MKTENHQRHRGRALKLLIATGILASACATSYAQAVIGSPGAGWQQWNVQQDLNNNGAPFWDAATTTDANYGGQDSGGPGKKKNIGFCLTGLGDCAAPNGLAGKPAGAVPFWGMPYNAASDTGGGMDLHVFFRAKSGEERSLKAKLLGNVSSIKVETNHIGWFETNATGTVIGKLHQLFQGGHSSGSTGQGLPPPSPIGSTASFTPTEYFGFYFIDVSEGSCISATLEDVAANIANNGGCGSMSDPTWLHNMVVFGKSGKHPRYYIAGEDPPGCGDSDCNLTVIRITQSDDDEKDD
jgi:hypothetical protein